MPPRIQLLLLLVLVTCTRLPFAHQAFQLDDPTYLAGARYVQHDPLHPAHTPLVFQGVRMDLRGHPHPPLDIWFLGLVLRLRGAISETPFHLAYIVFSLIATAGMFGLACRFTRHAALATLVFIAVPAFIVHGNSLESDLPLLAFWLAGTAAFVRAVDSLSRRWLAVSAVCLALAALAAYQAVLAVPILAWYGWTRKRGWRPALAVSAAPLLAVVLYQAWEAVSSGALPAAALAGNFSTYHLQSLHNKLRNALALTGHLGWTLFPPMAAAAFARLDRRMWAAAGVLTAAAVFADRSPLFWASFGLGAVILLYCARRARDDDQDTAFLALWVLLYFAGALAIFFAGAARYLLPIAAPLAILAARALDRTPKWLVGGFEAQFIFALLLAGVHYQQSGAYRDFVRAVEPQFARHRVFINGEWGLQYYGQQAGAQPLLLTEQLHPGDLLITSQLGFPISPNMPGCELAPLVRVDVTPPLPLRLVSLNARSAFSTIAFGVRPFDIRRAPADRLTLDLVTEITPKLAYLELNAPGAAEQIVRGLFQLEGGRWRWMGPEAVVKLKRLHRTAALVVKLVIPEPSPARRVTVELDGEQVAARTLPGPGTYTIEAPNLAPLDRGTGVVRIAVDKTFTPPGDSRRLSVILYDIGFR